MANEYISIREKDELGIIALTKGVFETITTITAKEETTVTLVDPTPFYRPVVCKVSKNALTISVDVKVKYGSNVSNVTEKLQNKIFQAIFNMTGLKCYMIDINVVGFLF